MKVAVIIPAEPAIAPYTCYYTKILEENEVPYDLIVWNRSETSISPAPYLFIYRQLCPDTSNIFSKLKGYKKFKKFIEKQIEENKYDFLIVHTINIAFFLKKYLLKNYKNKFILDIRDKGMFFLTRHRLPEILKNSAFNVISSPGFKTWLPKGDYIVSHNIGYNFRKKFMEQTCSVFQNPDIRILTIGIIRHYQTNRQLIDILANQPHFSLVFAGIGNDKDKLEKYCEQNNIQNTKFLGRYLKTQEDEIVKQCDVINILLPQNRVMYAMANRFYLAVSNCRPVIVNEESIQAKYVKQFHLGLVVKKNTDILKALVEYRTKFHPELYLEGRQLFLKEIQKDCDYFTNELVHQVKSIR